MKKNARKMIISVGLCLILVAVLAIELSIFITGPSQYYDHKVTSQVNTIKETYKDITDIHRHVFSYIIYSGHSNMQVYWFNEEGHVLTQRKESEIDAAKALALAKSEFHFEASQVSLGYGYDNPVYVIENEQGELYLDVDTLKQVFYRKKG